MRISDWSSDVCSSDLVEPARVRLPQLRGIEQNRADTVSTAAGAERRQAFGSIERGHPASLTSACLPIPLFRPPPTRWLQPRSACCGCPRSATRPTSCRWYARCDRSEEHTSELQSLMRISYAVFCFKKKK